MSTNLTDHAGEARRITYLGATVNLFLIALKSVLGVVGHSQALIADAFHSLSDLITDIVVLIGISIGSKSPDLGHHFGHNRYETIASTFIGIAILSVASYLGKEAILDIYYHTEQHPTWLAMIGAVISIAAKETIYQRTMRVARKTKSPVLVANAWHQRSDALSSIAVLIGVAGAQIKPSWHILDAYATLAVVALLLRVGIDILWKCFHEFTDAAPEPETLALIKTCTLQVDGVNDIHDLRVRTSGGLYQMELHIEVEPSLTVSQSHRIAKEVETCLTDALDRPTRMIIHVDPSKGAMEV